MKDTNTNKIILFTIQRILFPFFILATAFAMYFSQFNEIPTIAVQMIMFILSIIVVFILERWIPLHRKSHTKDKKDTQLNLTSFAVLMVVIDPLVKSITPVILSLVVIAVNLPVEYSLVPTDWNFISQLIIAALISELGQYWLHRLGHVSWLWRFHSAHHSSSRMNWLTGFRAHPFNMLYHHFSGVFILMLIGTSELVILTYIALMSVNNVFQHANIKFKHGFLNYIFSTNDLHRWHHSEIKHEANANYGAFIIIWDIVFSSYFNKRNEDPENYGLFLNKNYPVNSYWKQLIAPLFWTKWKIESVGDVK